jgi:hypothetical protein
LAVIKRSGSYKGRSRWLRVGFGSDGIFTILVNRSIHL